MCRRCDTTSAPINRREAIGLGLAGLAGVVVAPRVAGSRLSVPNPPSDLEVAIRAAKWIRASRIETPNGAVWPADPLEPTTVDTSLYNGFPGVVLFHLELFHATRERGWLDEAKLGADELIARLPAMHARNAAGLYEGLGGAVFVLEETHRASGDGKYRDAAKAAVSMIHAQARKTTLGAAWQGPSAANDIISGTAGIGLLLLWVDQMIGDPASRTLALAAGRQLLDSGIAVKGGTKWNLSPGVTNVYPNFSHGTAGVAYFLATLLRATGDRSFMAGALAGAQYLESVANTERGGFKVFHHEPGGEELYYMSWCHGPAGTSRLFHRLEQITQRAHWEDLAQAGARATIDSGAPEKQSPGYWNNVSQCCGNAGVGEFFIALQRRSPKPEYAQMIARVKANTLARATEEQGGLKWVQAENRVSPNAVVAQTGYMQGAAGIGSFFLHADALAKGRAPAILWPDSPAFEPCPAESTERDMSAMATKNGPLAQRCSR